jgi:hypothetical protein
MNGMGNLSLIVILLRDKNMGKMNQVPFFSTMTTCDK